MQESRLNGLFWKIAKSRKLPEKIFFAGGSTMRKIAGVFLAAAVVSQMAFAGGNAQRSGGGTPQKTVVFYSWWADAERSMGEALVADFEAANPGIKVEQNYIAYADYLSKINTMVASNGTPDVFYLNEYLITEWGEKGVVEDMLPFYKAKGIEPEKFFVDSALYTSGGHLWGVNSTSTTTCLYYNKELLSQAGIAFPPADAAKPWTWDQYVSAAKKLTKDVNGRTPADANFNYNNVIQYGTIMPTSWIYVLPLLYAGGSSVANDNGTALEITSDTGIGVIQNIANLALVEKVAPTVAMTQTNAFSNVPVMLMNGQLGMFIGGTFQFSDFTNAGYDVGIAQIPSPSGKGNNMAWSSGFVTRKDASPEALELAAYLTDFNNWVKASKKHGIGLTGLPQTNSTFDDPALNAAWIAQFDVTMAKTAGDILQNGSRLGENVTLKNFAEIMDQTIAPQLDKIWLGSSTARDALLPLNNILAGKLQGVWR
jgi:multiple sugar transport system substrate-binding protein